MTPNYWAAPEDDTPGIDIVLNHRVIEGKGWLSLCVSRRSC